jgi:hypothetical protein
VQAGEVEELLGRRLERFRGRDVERLRLVVTGLHGDSFRVGWFVVATILGSPYAALPRR